MPLLIALDGYVSSIIVYRYARDVKRAKLHEGRLVELLEYIRTACPVKSGSRHETHRQYCTDDALYEGYRQSTTAPVSFDTFYKYKGMLRVRRSRKYFGMFDCHICYRLEQIPSETTRADYATRVKLLIELAEAKKHRELVFISAMRT